MVKEIQYTNIRRVLDNLLDHPMLSDLTLEQVVRHTIRFIGLHGFSKFYQDKCAMVEIKDFRGLMPCDLISIIQVKDDATGICMRAMTDTFTPGIAEPDMAYQFDPRHEKPNKNLPTCDGFGTDWYIPKGRALPFEPSFKTQGRVIFTSFPEGKVEIMYKAIPVDEDGFPMVEDNENYLAALEAYIKLKVFTIKFDQGKISAGVLQNAQRDYGILAAQLEVEYNTPSVSEMESITRAWNTLISRVRQFDTGFRTLGDREYLINH